MGLIEIPDVSGAEPASVSLLITSLPRALAKYRTQITRLLIEGEAGFLGETLRYEGKTVAPGTIKGGTLIDVTVNGDPITLGLDTSLLALIASGKGRRKLPGDIGSDALALAVEHVLTADLEDFEAGHDVQLEITSIAARTNFDANLALGCTSVSMPGREPFNVYFWAEDNAALADSLSAVCPKKPARALPQIKVAAAYVGPLSVMSAHDVSQIAAGDVLDVCPEWDNLSTHVNLLVKNEYLVPLRASDTGFIADADEVSLSRMRKQFEDGATMPASEAEYGGSLNDPKTIVTVELMRMELAVSELADIQNGDIVDFDMAAIDTVRICSDGAAIAEGKLVQLDGSFGVQVTKLL